MLLTARRVLPILCLGVLGSLGGCLMGPQQLQRSVDDWDRKLYTNSPWLDVAFWILPIVPVSKIGAFVCDTLVTNPWAFWSRDAFAGNGTGFEHFRDDAPSGHLPSLTAPPTGGSSGRWLGVEPAAERTGTADRPVKPR